MLTPWADALTGTNIAKPSAIALTKTADEFLIAFVPLKEDGYFIRTIFSERKNACRG
jgi:hypothetical protein